MTRSARITLLCCTLLLAGADACASQQEDLERLRKRIAALQQEVEKTTESRSEAADALRESERAISNNQRTLSQLAQQQREAGQSLGRLQQQSRQIERDMQTQQAQLSQLLYQQYLGGKQEYLKLLLNNHDPNQVARELQYYEYIVRYRSTWLKTLRGNLTRMNAVTAQARQKSDEIAALQGEQRKQQQALEKEKRDHQQVLHRIALQLKQQRREIGRLQRDESRLAQLVEKLTHMLSQPGGSGKTALRPFSQLKGKLHLPLKGRIANKFGSRRPDSNIQWKGLFIKALPNQPVKAIAPGTVVFADWLRGFGNLLILDHGQGYMSLYGNNETLYKQLGDEVAAGDVVAAVGSSGGNEDSGLYFELRYEG
ncbi:MAG TPA: peptidoglycan DD-metalloendopeptidase family protein, partial [Gallionellaceae bacterium]|nr:peptidoglycan DD-metalloendopeptidase family protein [Gallionellaceae bacterium]